MLHANGVFVAPANTATNPIPARKAVGIGIKSESVLPNVAPIKNKGVTSPPLKPAEIVSTVRPSFNRKSVGKAGV